jgi:hypothetical protein
MFNREQWFLNDNDDLGVEVYGNEAGISTSPEPFIFDLLDPCGVGTYTGEIQLIDCAIEARVGIGTTQPQQRADINGSVKIDEDIYDSVNSPGKIAYILSKDNGGIRWVPPLSPPPGVPPFLSGIGSTTFLFVLDEGIPIVGFGTTTIPVA